MSKNRFLAIVPARGGSKGLKNKNLRQVKGTPLVLHTIISASKSKFINDIIITSDSDEILDLCSNMSNVKPYKRSIDLSQDNTSMKDVVLDVLTKIENIESYEYFILLQPTSPLRNSNHIDAAIVKLIDSKSDSLISSYEINNKYLKSFYEEEGRIKPLSSSYINSNRQQNPRLYLSNGAIYIVNISVFKKKKSFITTNTLNFLMTLEDSIDVDSMEDLILAEKKLK